MSPSFVTQATRRRFIVASSRSAVGIGAALLLSASVFAQDTRPTSRPDAVDRAIDDAETVIITATRTRKSPLDVPATTWTVDVAELEKTRPVRSLSDALEDAEHPPAKDVAYPKLAVHPRADRLPHAAHGGRHPPERLGLASGSQRLVGHRRSSIDRTLGSGVRIVVGALRIRFDGRNGEHPPQIPP